MTRSLAGLHVWITRPSPEAESSVRVWTQAGAVATAVPLLQVVRLELDDERIAPLLVEAPKALAFTSARACEHLVLALRRHAGLLSSLRRVSAWCVGASTADAARAAGFRVDFVGAGGGAAELGEEMLRRLPKASRVLFPCSAQRRPELARALRKASIQLIEWPVYDVVAVEITEPRQRAELEEQDPLFLLYSPSAAAAAARVVGDLDRSGTRVAAIGRSTAAAAREWELEVVAVAEKPTETALLRAVSDWWEREPL